MRKETERERFQGLGWLSYCMKPFSCFSQQCLKHLTIMLSLEITESAFLHGHLQLTVRADSFNLVQGDITKPFMTFWRNIDRSAEYFQPNLLRYLAEHRLDYVNLFVVVVKKKNNTTSISSYCIKTLTTAHLLVFKLLILKKYSPKSSTCLLEHSKMWLFFPFLL